MKYNVYDTYKSEKLSNSMTEWAEHKMNDYNFMPMIEILQWGEVNSDPELNF